MADLQLVDQGVLTLELHELTEAERDQAPELGGAIARLSVPTDGGHAWLNRIDVRRLYLALGIALMNSDDRRS